jgi:hypothetical protein|tara:strand:- start:752 stop:1480 length:729 start_codon:yes stop_codon:yes gene_type:complete
MAEFKFPSEEIELPSKGLLYPKDHPLSSGKIELKYMTAKEEDILTNQSYIQKGTVLNKLLDSVILTEGVKQQDLILGDKNAVLVATRVLGYGAEYKFTYRGEEKVVDLSSLENKEFDESLITPGKNEFEFVLPHTKTPITYKILTGGDEIKIDRELEGLKKINKNAAPELSTRLKYIITSVNGESGTKEIREFVDNFLLAIDSKALRKHLRDTQPDVDLRYIDEDGKEVAIPIGISFFWPEL